MDEEYVLSDTDHVMQNGEPDIGETQPTISNQCIIPDPPTECLYSSWKSLIPTLVLPFLNYTFRMLGKPLPPYSPYILLCKENNCEWKLTKILCLLFNCEWLLVIAQNLTVCRFFHHRSCKLQVLHCCPSSCPWPSQPRMAISINLLVFYCSLFEWSCDAINALTSALHSDYVRWGFCMVNKHVCFASTRWLFCYVTASQNEAIHEPFQCSLGFSVQWFDILHMEVKWRIEVSLQVLQGSVLICSCFPLIWDFCLINIPIHLTNACAHTHTIFVANCLSLCGLWAIQLGSASNTFNAVFDSLACLLKMIGCIILYILSSERPRGTLRETSQLLVPPFPNSQWCSTCPPDALYVQCQFIAKTKEDIHPPQGTHNVDGFVHSPPSSRAGSSDCELRSPVTSRRELNGEASVLLTEEDKEAAEALPYILVDETLPLLPPRVEDTRTKTEPCEHSLHRSSQQYCSQSHLDCRWAILSLESCQTTIHSVTPFLYWQYCSMPSYLCTRQLPFQSSYLHYYWAAFCLNP